MAMGSASAIGRCSILLTHLAAVFYLQEHASWRLGQTPRPCRCGWTEFTLERHLCLCTPLIAASILGPPSLTAWASAGKFSQWTAEKKRERRPIAEMRTKPGLGASARHRATRHNLRYSKPVIWPRWPRQKANKKHGQYKAGIRSFLASASRNLNCVCGL